MVQTPEILAPETIYVEDEPTTQEPRFSQADTEAYAGAGLFGALVLGDLVKAFMNLTLGQKLAIIGGFILLIGCWIYFDRKNSSK